MRFLFINGPNVNITRFTEPGVEGEVDYNGLLDYLDVCCQQMGIEPDFVQSNHEGDIIDEIQSAAGRADGIILNPGGYAYYSVAILEALQLKLNEEGLIDFDLWCLDGSNVRVSKDAAGARKKTLR